MKATSLGSPVGLGSKAGLAQYRPAIMGGYLEPFCGWGVSKDAVAIRSEVRAVSDAAFALVASRVPAELRVKRQAMYRVLIRSISRINE
jgi:hypothetical protein